MSGDWFGPRGHLVTCVFTLCRYFFQVNIDFEKEPIGTGKNGKPVFLRDIWPSSEEIAKVSLYPQRLRFLAANFIL
jgi:hypothetical protein